MSSLCHQSPLKKSHTRQRRRKLPRGYVIKTPPKMKTPPTFAGRLQELLGKFQQQEDSRLSIGELESIASQIALEYISSTPSKLTKTNISCPLVCLFCEHFISEPLTLYCGHTVCESCIVKNDVTSPNHCPRCSKDIQEQTLPAVERAREMGYSKSHSLKQILERSEPLKVQYANRALCRQAESEYGKENYHKAVDIYSAILDKFDDHYAYSGRAKTYIAMKELDKALVDVEQVVTLKPQWNKGYYYRSQILTEMKRHTAALLSSLQGLTLDPEDRIGKQIVARHLHTILYDNVEKESAATMENELSLLLVLEASGRDAMISGSSDNQLLKCKSAQSALCLCTLFDGKHLSTKDFDCSVCANLLWFPVTTPCGHIFCRECLIRSIDNTQAQCPMCKTPVEEFFSMLVQSHVNQTEVIGQLIETYFPKEFHERRQLYEQQNVEGVLIPKSLAPDTESMTFEIPIFVCVLALPHSTCPLHVFEPRYRLMMRRTIDTESRTFGMCKFDESTGTFADYGTLLFIRGYMFTQDGRSVVDTIGQRRFRVLERGQRDEYCTARVQLIRDEAIKEEDFDDSFQLNRTTYQRVRDWFDGVDAYRRTLISRQLEEYPSCDDLVEGSADGPAWAWIMLNVLPIEPDLQYSVLISQSFRSRLQVINGTIDFLLEYQQRHDQQLQQQQQQDLEREEEHEREHEQTPEEPIPLASE